MVVVDLDGAPPRRGIKGLSLPWKGFVLPVGLLILAELVARLTGFDSDSVPLPSEIGVALIHALQDGSIFNATGETLSAALGGLAIGATIGLVLGVAFGVFPVVFWLLEFTTEIIRPIPAVALIPVALLIFGFGYSMEISLVAKSTIWPILFVTHAAVGGIERKLMEVSALLKMRFINVVRKIVIPAVVPAIFVGFRLSMGLSLLITVATEIAVNPRGLGYAMMRAEETLRFDLMFALLFWVGLLGWGINAGLEILQHRVFDYMNRGRGER